MRCIRRLPRTDRRRAGFTLIELMVAMAILAVVLYMTLGSLLGGAQVSRRGQQRITVEESLTTVMNQLTSELKESVGPSDTEGGALSSSDQPGLRVWPVGTTNLWGVTVPAWRDDRDTQRGLEAPRNPDGSFNADMSILDPGQGTGYPPLAGGQVYAFRTPVSTKYLLEFFTRDENNVKHRIRYTLGVPVHGTVARQYWASAAYEPCEVLYSNETWDGTEWSGTVDQPITEQVVTRFTVIRPRYSDKVVQIVLEAYEPNLSGKGSSPVRLVSTVALRQ